MVIHAHCSLKSYCFVSTPVNWFVLYLKPGDFCHQDDEMDALLSNISGALDYLAFFRVFMSLDDKTGFMSLYRRADVIDGPDKFSSRNVVITRQMFSSLKLNTSICSNSLNSFRLPSSNFFDHSLTSSGASTSVMYIPGISFHLNDEIDFISSGRSSFPLSFFWCITWEICYSQVLLPSFIHKLFLLS